VTFVVRLHANAQRDFWEAQAYYDPEAPDQTERFIDEFFGTVRLLAEFPYSSPELRRGARRANLPVFPYQLWYLIDDAAKIVQVIAVLHHRQDPARLNPRLGLP
jgi:plasmid stabilization system protein ParE